MSDIRSVRRADTAAALTTATSTLANTASDIGALALIADDGSGNVGLRKWSGTAWVSASLSGTVGTLAGDVTGPSSASVAEQLTGSAGVVAMKATTMRWAAGVDFILSQATQTADTPTHDFNLTLQTPFASATGGNRSSPSGYFTVPAPVSGGSYGVWGFRHGLTNTLTLAQTLVTVGVPTVTFESTVGSATVSFAQKTSGVGDDFTLQGQRSLDNNGGNTFIGSGQGVSGGVTNGSVILRTGLTTNAIGIIPSSPQPVVHFYGNSVRWDKASAPVLFQEQQTSNVVPPVMRFRSSDPWASASGDARIAGNMQWEIGDSVNGADRDGHYEWWIAEQRAMACWYGKTILYNGQLEFVTSDTITAPSVSIGPDDAGVGGAALTLIAQDGGPDAGPGGHIIAQSGAGTLGQDAGGFVVMMGSATTAILQLVQIEARLIYALGFTSMLASADVPPFNSNYLLLADAFNLDSVVVSGVGPTGAILLASHGGKFVFQNESGDSIRFDGPLADPSAGVLGHFAVTVNGLPGRIQILEP